MKGLKKVVLTLLIVGLASIPAWAAYHHQGEQDADKFLSAYPNKAGTKLDHCALCHTGGLGPKGQLGSCQWCHYHFGYDGQAGGTIDETMNDYGRAYRDAGRLASSLETIENLDSDNDTYSNIDEINAIRYPGDPGDDPSMVTAPCRIYTRAQIEALTAHTQFMLMNTSRHGDFYAEYTGVPIKDLLDDAGVLGTAANIIVYAPDGWSQTHPMEYDNQDDEAYHVYGNMTGETCQYPPAAYHYNTEADEETNPDYGWCDYSAPSCTGRSDADPIFVENGLKAILAYRREGVYMDPGVLNDENKLDGEGPFRLVVPQKIDPPPPPDQSSRYEGTVNSWPYNDETGDHNAGACSRSATIVRVGPLPAGMTDIDILEAGWSYVDNNKIIIYGAIDGTDADGDGVLASEEGAAADADPGMTMVREACGGELIQMEAANGSFENVACLADDDPAVPQTNKPASIDCPFGALRFQVSGLNLGDEVDVTLTFPENVPTDAKYYKIHPVRGWVEIPFGSNDGDNVIVLTLKDGDPDLDADGQEDGIIVDPGAVTVASAATSSDGGSSGCFIATAAFGSALEPRVKLLQAFRDRFLLDSAVGRSFVQTYYKYSPPLAASIAERQGLKAIVRISLLPLVLFAETALQYGLMSTLIILLGLFALGGGLGWFMWRFGCQNGYTA